MPILDVCYTKIWPSNCSRSARLRSKGNASGDIRKLSKRSNFYLTIAVEREQIACKALFGKFECNWSGRFR